MGDEFETCRERIEAHPTIKSYLASRTADQLAELIWSEMHRGNVFGSYKGTVGDHSRAILAAVEAETAERVERETIERCAEFVDSFRDVEVPGWLERADSPADAIFNCVSEGIATAIRSLPAKCRART